MRMPSVTIQMIHIKDKSRKIITRQIFQINLVMIFPILTKTKVSQMKKMKTTVLVRHMKTNPAMIIKLRMKSIKIQLKWMKIIWVKLVAKTKIEKLHVSKKEILKIAISMKQDRNLSTISYNNKETKIWKMVSTTQYILSKVL